MKEKVLKIIILLIWILTCNCGEGMIGLITDPESGITYMTEVFPIENGCTYFVEVGKYYEVGLDCETGDSIIPEDDKYELTVWKRCFLWAEAIELTNPYINIISEALHEQYLFYVCKGEI